MPSKIHTLLLFGPIIITCLSPPRTTAATAVHFHSVDHTLTHHPRRESPPRTTAFDQGDVERQHDYGSRLRPSRTEQSCDFPGTVLLSPRWPCRFPRALAPSIRTTSRSIPVMSRLAASLIIVALTESFSTTSFSREMNARSPLMPLTCVRIGGKSRSKMNPIQLPRLQSMPYPSLRAIARQTRPNSVKSGEQSRMTLPRLLHDLTR